MYHFQKSFNPTRKPYIYPWQLYKSNFKWANYELKTKAQEINNFNKWRKK
jgi:hypothetical protein